MQCTKCNADLTPDARFCSLCSAPVAAGPSSVHTGGGAFFGGSVSAGRDVVGRDQHIGTQTHSLVFTQSFQAVYEQITAHAAKHADADPDLLKDTAARIEQEAAKGEAADSGIVRGGLNTLARLAPDVLEVAVNALTNPAAAVGSAVKLVANAFRGGSAIPPEPPNS